MNQERLDCIASRRVLGLAIDRNAQSLRTIDLLIHIQMANTIGMAKDRNSGVVLDETDQLVATPRNNQVHKTIEPEQSQALRSGC